MALNLPLLHTLIFKGYDIPDMQLNLAALELEHSTEIGEQAFAQENGWA